MPSPPFHPEASEASGFTFPYLLDALAKEYERLQHENASLVATLAHHASSSPHQQVETATNTPCNGVAATLANKIAEANSVVDAACYEDEKKTLDSREVPDELCGGARLDLKDTVSGPAQAMSLLPWDLGEVTEKPSKTIRFKEAVQDLLDSPETMTKQISPTSELSQSSADSSLIGQKMSVDTQTSVGQPLVGDRKRSSQQMHRLMSTRAASSFMLAPQDFHFEMSARWKAQPELIHQPVPSVPHVPSLRTLSKVGSMSHKELADGYLRALHPDSVIRHVWILGCIILLLLDLFWVPIQIGFEVPETPVTQVIHYTSMIYWSLDIPMNFLTGLVFVTHVELRLSKIAKVYAHSWLCFDILLVLPDYFEVLAEDFPDVDISFLRVLRWGRFMRLLRVARLSKVSKLKPFIRGVAVRYHLSRMYVEVTRGLVGLICMVLVGMHVQSCLWHLFGAQFEDGWIQANHLGSAGLGRLYTISLYWSCCRLNGSSSGYDVKTVPELVVDTLLLFVNLITAASLLSHVTVLIITRTTSKPFNLWKSSVAYSIRHDLSYQLEMRLGQWLSVTDFGNIGEIAEEEQELLCTVPDSLRQDLLFETRLPFLSHKQFIRDMVQINERAARHLCFHAITEAVLAPHEVIFSQGDPGLVMRFVAHGSFDYSYFKSEHAEECIDLKLGTSISEAVLWTKWEHIGELKAVDEPRMLLLDHELFAHTVTNHTGSFVHAVRYAKHFVQRLNQHVPFVHDIMSFEELDIELLNDNIYDNSDEKHFIFISHYKVEAGTEATLMFDRLKDLLMNDPEHAASYFVQPVFIDSENLTDLANLKQHVKNSDILLILLTPGILSRPWCLIEIATAIKYSVGVVLVDIQRPGSKFQYPDENFYTNFLAAKTLDSQSVSLIESQGITLKTLEKALRRIFCKISLPFSPHRSEEVREAELHDILKRCNFEFGQDLRSKRDLHLQSC